MSPSDADAVVDFCCVVVVEAQFASKVLGGFIVVENLYCSSSNVDCRCSLSTAAFAQIAENARFVGTHFWAVRLGAVVQMLDHVSKLWQSNGEV